MDTVGHSSNTLNKYSYGANNPLLYIDPTGRDVTVFYRRPTFGNPIDFGHILIVAVNQKTGEARALDFYEENGKSTINRNVNFSRLMDHAAITIQTTPEAAQEMINLIKSLEGTVPTCDALYNNCTVLCEIALDLGGIEINGDIFPTDLWNMLYAAHSDEAMRAREQLGNPFFAPPSRYETGREFGRPSFLPGSQRNMVFEVLSLILRNQRAGAQQEPVKPVRACVIAGGTETCDPPKKKN